MSRRLARLFFFTAATALASALLVAVAFALGPQTLPGRSPDEIALIRLEALQSNVVVRLEVKELSGLDRLANEERERKHMTLWDRAHARGACQSFLPTSAMACAGSWASTLERAVS
ncbi:MAG TPA: hypothetical protein VJ726_10225 [Candidatus Limnocylindria bacterium]|nr:hypothetical protein [Candidatus Limnocylindria bacterium]